MKIIDFFNTVICGSPLQFPHLILIIAMCPSLLDMYRQQAEEENKIESFNFKRKEQGRGPQSHAWLHKLEWRAEHC